MKSHSWDELGNRNYQIVGMQKLMKDTIYLQRILHLGGFDCGEVDGIRGRKTDKAVEKWLLEADLYKREYGSLDSRSESNLETLLPICQKLIRRWFLERVKGWAEMHDVVVKIICGTRTWAEQNDLYAQGRTKSGNKVTNAKAGYSFHNFGVAFDIGIFDAKGKYLTSDALYDKLFNDCGSPDCFDWGGNFKSLHDAPHYQYNEFGDTSSKIRKRFLAKG